MDKKQYIEEVVPLRGRLLNYARHLLKDEEEAEDIIQELFLKLWNMRSSLGEYNSILALSYQITKHLCFNCIKARKRCMQEMEGIDIMSETLTPDTQLEQKDSVEKMMRIIDQLPNLQQAILRMKHIEGLEVKEIAELTGSNPEAIRMNLSRARKHVKDVFLKI